MQKATLYLILSRSLEEMKCQLFFGDGGQKEGDQAHTRTNRRAMAALLPFFSPYSHNCTFETQLISSQSVDSLEVTGSVANVPSACRDD